MRLSIAIPHYHNKQNLKRLLDSLLNQYIVGFTFEIIVINDDDKYSLDLEKYNKNINGLKIINIPHQGVAAARNEAINKATGEYIFFIDQDCVADKKWIYNLYNHLVKSDIDVCGVGGKILPLFLNNSTIVNDYFNFINVLNRPIVDKKTGNIICIITANSAFKIECLKKVGGFRHSVFTKNFHGGEDVDLTYRLKKYGYKVNYEPSAVVYHEYPRKISDIIYKFANYGLGMRMHCIGNNIKPSDIRQPELNFNSLIYYFVFTIFYKTFKFSSLNFNNLKLKELIIYSFFELLRNIGHGYGYFNKKYKRKIITG